MEAASEIQAYLRSDSEPPPKAKTRPGTHDAVLRLLESEERGRVLDLPAGEGALTIRLIAMGFEPVCADIEPATFKLKGIPCEKVDMEQPLPFESGSFDYICCVEGIEHIRRPFEAIREFSRVLKDDGKLIITSPNILRLTSRLIMLVCGNLELFSDFYKPPAPGVWDLDHHVQPFGYLQARYIMAWAGLYPEQVTVNTVATLNRIVHLPAYWALRLGWALAPRARRERKQVRVTNSMELLAGRVMVLKAAKGAHPQGWQPQIVPPYNRVIAA